MKFTLRILITSSLDSAIKIMVKFKYTLEGTEGMGLVSISSQDLADVAATQLDLINQGWTIVNVDYGRNNFTYLYIERKSK